ncbi:SURF1 family protein [Wenzhouxiangella marina]|uniref:SURF1-like protein n=1 Tax=Wenzhouxiangella marina TaxID=1579979 RepID=A0A0K0XW12_9GAMM|nr:SURF1 family protein [Wenzhouxiangella marina]AKS41894.1 hypothetical protein WM2015_1524 [Wenzhouxiangella marina]MBB6086339.1 cytochrome oxidase assembly protein ShyY1 [Wenzhouxiangella marina]
MSTPKVLSVLRAVIPHLAAILMLSLTVRLAFWQLDRAEEKAQLLAEWERAGVSELDGRDPAELPRLSSIRAQGRFDPQRHLLLDNQIRNNFPGVHVFSLFQPDDGAPPFLVNRGWQPWQRNAGSFPEFQTPLDRVTIEGRVAPPPRVGFRLGEARVLDPEDWPALVTYLDLDRVREVFGDELSDRILLLDPSDPAHLSGDPWPRVNMGPEKHRGYAFQWAAISAAILVLWLGLSLRKLIHSRRASGSR